MRNPGMVLFTLANPTLRRSWKKAAGHSPFLAAPLDSVTDAMSNLLGQGDAQPARAASISSTKPISARIDAIQFTIAHDDGVGCGELGGSGHRSSRRLAHRPDEPRPASISPIAATRRRTSRSRCRNRRRARQPVSSQGIRWFVGSWTTRSGTIGRRSPQPVALSLNQTPETAYVDLGRGEQPKSPMPRPCIAPNNGWPVIDVTRRSIEETAAAIISLYRERIKAETYPTPARSGAELRRMMFE